jgi:hypothetical protein
MSETLHDHGGHTQHGGGESAGFSGTHHHGGENHGFLSHLLGTDHDHSGHAHSGHHHHHAGEQPGPSGSPSWNSALQGLKLTDALQGINVTPNTMLLFMFIAFFGWLYVVYFVRHHQPLNSGVISTNGAAYSATAHMDRHIVGNIKHAYPVRTGPHSGEVYTPKPVDPTFNGIPTDPTVSQLGAYHLPVHTQSGLKLKTVVNR